MKTNEELNAIKKEWKNKQELNDEEMDQVTGGLSVEHIRTVKSKADKLLSDGKIDTNLHYLINMSAISLPEASYESWAKHIAGNYGLNPADIMY